MKPPFSRTMRALEARPAGMTLWFAAIGLGLLALWAGWFLFSQVSVYEVTESARLEVSSEPHLLTSVVAGRVVNTYVSLGDQVSEGDLLLELDSEDVQHQLAETQAGVDGARQRLERLQVERQAQASAMVDAGRAKDAAIAQARAREAEVIATAELAANELQRNQRLHGQGLLPTAQLESSQVNLQRRRAAVDAAARAIDSLIQERRVEQSEKRAELMALDGQSAELEAQVQTLGAVDSRLTYAEERHRIRAPIDGKVGDLTNLKVGEVIEAGSTFGSVIPDGTIRGVAEFEPYQALGRIRSGQTAQFRMKGFSWIQFGTIRGEVTRVASEPQNGRVRVELSIQHSEGGAGGSVPIEHGLPGLVQVEVEQISPAALVLRAVGRRLARPVGSE